MKNTIISIYPDEGGNLSVNVTKDEREIHFISSNKNIFYLVFKIEYKLFTSWLNEKFAPQTKLSAE